MVVTRLKQQDSDSASGNNNKLSGLKNSDHASDQYF